MDFSSMLEIISQRLVKPSTSTPPSLRWYKLSLNDRIQNAAYIPLAFFYPNQGFDSPVRSTSTEMSQILSTALSKTLSYYYPFAGRLRDNVFIECNDLGVYFTVLRIKCTMSEFQNHSNSIVKFFVFPSALWSPQDGDASLLQVQLNYFDCGGMAVSLCMSHTLGDISTFLTFFHDWAAVVHQSNHIPSPEFIGASLFPPTDDLSLVKEIGVKRDLNPVKHLLFRGPKIAELKDMVAKTSGVEKPTRVEVVSALLYKCAVDSSRQISGSFRPAGLVCAVNLRPMTVPPLPKEAVGNISVGVVIPTPKEQEITLPELVSKIRNKKVNIKNEYKEAKTTASPSVKLAMAQPDQSPISNLDLYFCTSWCRFPFYDADFGRGKPMRVYFPDQGGTKNIFVLRDARNEDAIEVLAFLQEPEMSAFETNEELLAFASLGE